MINEKASRETQTFYIHSTRQSNQHVYSNNISLFKNYKDAKKASLQTTHRVSISDSSRSRVYHACVDV